MFLLFVVVYPTVAPTDHPQGETMLVKAFRAAGLRSTYLQAASLGSIALCLGLWVRAKTVDQDHRDNAERRALFVGLWPPMLWLIGDSLQELEEG
jgi:4-amino-4-deoxy-L-arabinose transferase-like glycosyltransferase